MRPASLLAHSPGLHALTRPIPPTPHPDYEEDVLEPTPAAAPAAAADGEAAPAQADSKDQKGSYVGVHSTGFRDFLLKPELLRAISDLGFEHPSEVQQECIPQAILGMDVLCQAKSGMGASSPSSSSPSPRGCAARAFGP